MFTITAIAVMGGALFGSSFTSQMTGAALSTDVNALQKIHDMGGLELVMPAAFAEAGNCDSDEYADRTVVEFPLTGVSIDLPRMGGGTFSAMTFSEQIPGPTLRVTQGDVVKMTLTVPDGEPTHTVTTCTHHKYLLYQHLVQYNQELKKPIVTLQKYQGYTNTTALVLI